MTIAHENAAGFTSYTMTEEQATPAVLDQQVAVCGEWTLTNRELAYYFWQQYSNMYQQYGQMLLYILQSSVGLDEQALPDDPSTTWQQAFLDSAVSNFGLIAAVVQDAEKNGFVLGEELQSQVDSMRDTLAPVTATPMPTPSFRSSTAHRQILRTIWHSCRTTPLHTDT